MKLAYKIVWVVLIGLITAIPLIYADGTPRNDTVITGDSQYGNTDKKRGGGNELRKEVKGDEESAVLSNQQKEQIRLKEMVKEQLAVCLKISAEIREMAKNTNFSKEQRLQLQEKIRTALQANVGLINTMGDKEKKQVKNQLKVMEQIRTRLNAEINALTETTAKEDDPVLKARIQKQIKTMVNEMIKLENQYRAMEWIVKD